MAIMWPRRIPPDVRENPTRSTEIDVFEKLERQLDDSWSVFYSRPWLGLTPSGEERDGECDFVVANAKRGVLFLEVKGGVVSWNPATDRWKSRDRYGIQHNIKNPVYQARTSKHRLMQKLRETRGFGERWITARHGVVLPDSANPGRDLGPDRPQRIFCFSDDFERGFGAWTEARLEQPDPSDDGRGPLGVDGMHALEQLLARPIELRPSLTRVLEAENREIEFLTQQQFQLLEAISDQQRVLIQGGAGTGKTILACKLACELADTGLQVLLVCFNRPLADRLSAQFLPRQHLEILTFHQLCYSVIRQAGGQAPPESGDPAVYFRQALPEAAEMSTTSRAVKKFDAIIVDEGQDFSDLWWIVLESMFTAEGPRLMRVFADDNQQIYGNTMSIRRNLCLSPIQLSWNLRNTQEIHRAAYQHYRGRNTICRGPDGVQPQCIEVPDVADAFGMIRSTVERLTRNEGVPPNDIAIMLPNDQYRRGLVPNGELLGIQVTDASVRENGKFIVDTVRRFKGLESLVAVIFVDDSIAASDELAYISMSRAKLRLFLIGNPHDLRSVTRAAP